MIESQNPKELNSARIIAFSTVFFIITSITIYWTRFSGGLALVWFGTALLSSFLVNLRLSAWLKVLPVFALLSAVSTSIFGFGPEIAAQLAMVNIFEATLVALLLIGFRPQRDYLESSQGFVSLMLWAGIVGPAIASVPGGWLVHHFIGRPWSVNAIEWSLGHGLGTMLACPITLLFARGSIASLMKVATNRGYFELAILSLAIVVTSLLTFYQSTYPLLFLPMLPLTLTCFRLGRIGAAVSVLLIAALAMGSLFSGVGPFANLPVPFAEKAIFLQLYLAAIVLFSLPVATVLKNYEVLRLKFFKRAALQRLFSDHSDDALLTLNSDGKIRYASPASSKICGQDDLLDEHLSIFFDGEDRPIVEAVLSSASADPEQTKFLERCATKKDRKIWLEARIRFIHQLETEIVSYVVSIRDVTTRKKEYLDRSKTLGLDHLTGLPNRRAFLATLEQRLATANENAFSVAIIDFDNFDQINGRFGHHIGDMALKHFANMARRMSSQECYFARVGGQEFAMLCHGASLDQSKEICEKLRRQFGDQKIHNADGKSIGISVSIGLINISNSCSASIAMEAAYDSLYSAKQAGRNNVQSQQGVDGWKHRDPGRERSVVNY